MTLNTSYSNDALLGILGERLTQRRISMSLTQADLAQQAGISKRTIENVENGGSTHLANFVRILRVLGLLDAMMNAIPEPSISPMQMLRFREKTRKRVSKKMVVREQKKPWTWGDEK